LADVKAMLEVFKKYGHTEVDTALAYSGGTSEKYLADLDYKAMGFKVSTKVYPGSWRHTSEDLEKSFVQKSLKSLKTDKVDIFYLHAPDRKTPWEVTFKATDDLYKQGKFERLGISNFMSWEVAEVIAICDKHGWVKPTVYQGIYNAVHRAIEPELIPCLRKYGIAFYEYNPLGGGFFTGKYRSMHAVPEEGSRFDISKGTNQAKNYRARYWNEEYFKALDIIETAAAKHKLTLGETALRWVNHHSVMKKEYGDAIIIGASSVKHLEENLADLEKGPLPHDVLHAVDQAWELVKGINTKYWH